MPYSTNHLGINFELHPRDDGAVDINITPKFVQGCFTPAQIGEVYVNGNPMTSFDKHDGYDIEKLTHLGKTLGIESTIPSTIYSFADIRVRRHVSELDKCRFALKAAKASLEEIYIAEEDYVGGVVAAEERQSIAIALITTVLASIEN